MESEGVFTKQQRIANNARVHPAVSFTSLAYHIDLEWLREAYRRTRKDGALGVDGQSAELYAADLDNNLKSLLERAKSGAYQAPPVRRVHIPKGPPGKEMRPIGIPTFEDKVLQRAVQMVLEPLYEQEFLECSYGFRPGRSAHMALEALRSGLMEMGGGWIIDLDVRKFFDTLDHSHLREILKQRVCDGVLTRLIGKWLKAGVMEDGSVSYPGQGSPQGGVISPMLSNVYLHEVLDKWFAEEVEERLHGRGFLIRFADDAVLAFEDYRDAQRVMDVLPKRFAKYGLTVHPEKTKIVRFTRPHRDTAGSSQQQWESFNFLGFAHYWGCSRKGNWVVKKKTQKSRFTRALMRIAAWCRWNRHRPLGEQQQTLGRKLSGHYAYYGVTGNGRALSNFRYQVIRVWRKWLSRRARGRPILWERFNLLLQHYPLPTARVVHSVYTANL
jgi:group II intron reverse transcriptase/maturase